MSGGAIWRMTCNILVAVDGQILHNLLTVDGRVPNKILIVDGWVSS